MTLGLGIAGMGVAGSLMHAVASAHRAIHAIRTADPLVAGCDHRDATALAVDPVVDAVYVATPTQLHRDHANAALAAGKHVIVEKPMAVSSHDCEALVSAAADARLVLVAGHSHAYEPGIRALAGLVRAGELGELGWIATWAGTDWVRRLRPASDLDPAYGGGAVFRQGTHQVDIVRAVSGRSIESVSAHVVVRAGVEAGYQARFDLAGGASAVAIYDGSGHFPTEELTFGAGEGVRVPSPHQAHFGITVVSGSDGDARLSKDGVYVYRPGAARPEERAVTGPSGRHAVLDDLVAAVESGVAPPHDGAFGTATVRVIEAIRAAFRG